MSTMKAAVIYEAGGPDVLKLESRPIPTPKPGHVLIRVKAFGLNRSELFTRQGRSPNVKFPRILGIEACGIVEDAPDTPFHKGEVVATAMGNMGRAFDGGYAEYTLVPADQVQVVRTELPWEVLGAIPEMMQTAWGSLFRTLRLKRGETLLVRGGTSSVGLAAGAIAKAHGAHVISTTRRADREEMLLKSGAAVVVVDEGNEVAWKVRRKYPRGVDKCLELIRATTIPDSLLCMKQGGIVCWTGVVGGKAGLRDTNPMELIPPSVCLSVYAGEKEDFMRTPLEEIARQIKAGEMHVQIGKVFHLDQIVEASRVQEENSAGGKIVVLT